MDFNLPQFFLLNIASSEQVQHAFEGGLPVKKGFMFGVVRNKKPLSDFYGQRLFMIYLLFVEL